MIVTLVSVPRFLATRSMLGFVQHSM